MSNGTGFGFSAVSSGKGGFTSGGLPNIPILGVNLVNLATLNNGKQGGGGGIRGIIPQQTYDSDRDFDDYEKIRFTLRNAWNTTYKTQLSQCTIPEIQKTKKSLQTPFRIVNNAGDLLLRQYYTCGGPCQTYQNRPGLHGLKQKFGSIQSICDGSNVEPATCNQHWVYDSSDYIKYKKQAAMVKNYNDITEGGSNNGSYVALKAIRRY
jgi:hypothetical protein